MNYDMCTIYIVQLHALAVDLIHTSGIMRALTDARSRAIWKSRLNMVKIPIEINTDGHGVDKNQKFDFIFSITFLGIKK